MSNGADQASRLYHEAISLSQNGNFEPAIARLEEAIQLNPNFPDALEVLGIYYSRVNRLDEAIETMKRLAHVSPNHIMAHTNLSRFYVQKGMILEAEQEQAEARRLSWKAELKTQKLAGAKSKTPEEEARDQVKDIESRMERYKKVIQLDPKDVLGYFSLGSTYLEAKRLDDAKLTFEQAIQIDPKHSPSYFSLGLALESLGRKQEAVEIYQKGIPVAESRGDMIPLKKMQARLEMLSK